MRDLKNNVSPAQSLAPAARTASANGTGVDIRDYDSAVAVVDLGLWTDGTFLFKLEESDSSGSGYTDVASGDLEGAFTSIAGTAVDNTIQRVGYKGGKRYVRVAVTQSASPCSTGLVCAAHILRGHAKYKPSA